MQTCKVSEEGRPALHLCARAVHADRRPLLIPEGHRLWSHHARHHDPGLGGHLGGGAASHYDRDRLPDVRALPQGLLKHLCRFPDDLPADRRRRLMGCHLDTTGGSLATA